MSPLLSSTLLLEFMCVMMKIISERAQNRHTKVEGRERVDLNYSNMFLKHYNGIPLFLLSTLICS